MSRPGLASQVKGYRRIVFCQSVRDDVDGALGGNAWADLMPRMCEGRLVPTPWLNKVHSPHALLHACIHPFQHTAHIMLACLPLQASLSAPPRHPRKAPPQSSFLIVCVPAGLPRAAVPA